MTWDWDQGSKANHPVVISSDNSPDNLVRYGQSRDHEEMQLERLRCSPAVFAMVERKLQKSLGRTADIPLLCGRDWVFQAIAFGIVGEKVELICINNPLPRVLKPTKAGSQKYAYRLTGENTPQIPLTVLGCPHGEQKRTRLWLFQQGLRALANDDTMHRPSIQIHAPRR